VSGPVLSATQLVVRRGHGPGGFELRVEALDLFAAEVLAVLGPNGAGKSTLLRALATLEPIVEGAIDHRAGGPVTMVFQRSIVFAGTVLHNLEVALLGARLPRDEVAKRAQAALADFGIASLAARNAATLSGGEMRRLALARAFAIRPAVLLLDEPFEDLDAAAQESLSIDLRRAIAQTGVAVAVVTHDLRRALLLADRVAILRGGRLVQCGPRDSVLKRPADAEAARLVGMSNLVEGVVEADAHTGPPHVVIDPAHRIPLPVDVATGERVWVGIRPEDLIADVAPSEGVPIGSGVVRHVVSDGVVTTATLDWGGTRLRTHWVAGRGLARTVSVGDTLTVAVRPEAVHLMRSDPGARAPAPTAVQRG